MWARHSLPFPHYSTSDALAGRFFGPSPALPYDPGEQGDPPLHVVAPARGPCVRAASDHPSRLTAHAQAAKKHSQASVLYDSDPTLSCSSKSNAVSMWLCLSQSENTPVENA
jgi:hypothetical protein